MVCTVLIKSYIHETVMDSSLDKGWRFPSDEPVGGLVIVSVCHVLVSKIPLGGQN